MPEEPWWKPEYLWYSIIGVLALILIGILIFFSRKEKKNKEIKELLGKIVKGKKELDSKEQELLEKTYSAKDFATTSQVLSALFPLEGIENETEEARKEREEASERRLKLALGTIGKEPEDLAQLSKGGSDMEIATFLEEVAKGEHLDEKLRNILYGDSLTKVFEDFQNAVLKAIWLSKEEAESKGMGATLNHEAIQEKVYREFLEIVEDEQRWKEIPNLRSAIIELRNVQDDDTGEEAALTKFWQSLDNIVTTFKKEDVQVGDNFTRYPDTLYRNLVQKNTKYIDLADQVRELVESVMGKISIALTGKKQHSAAQIKQTILEAEKETDQGEITDAQKESDIIKKYIHSELTDQIYAALEGDYSQLQNGRKPVQGLANLFETRIKTIREQSVQGFIQEELKEQLELALQERYYELKGKDHSIQELKDTLEIGINALKEKSIQEFIDTDLALQVEKALRGEYMALRTRKNSIKSLESTFESGINLIKRETARDVFLSDDLKEQFRKALKDPNYKLNTQSYPIDPILRVVERDREERIREEKREEVQRFIGGDLENQISSALEGRPLRPSNIDYSIKDLLYLFEQYRDKSAILDNLGEPGFRREVMAFVQGNKKDTDITDSNLSELIADLKDQYQSKSQELEGLQKETVSNQNHIKEQQKELDAYGQFKQNVAAIIDRNDRSGGLTRGDAPHEEFVQRLHFVFDEVREDQEKYGNFRGQITKNITYFSDKKYTFDSTSTDKEIINKLRATFIELKDQTAFPPFVKDFEDFVSELQSEILALENEADSKTVSGFVKSTIQRIKIGTNKSEGIERVVRFLKSTPKDENKKYDLVFRREHKEGKNEYRSKIKEEVFYERVVKVLLEDVINQIGVLSSYSSLVEEDAGSENHSFNISEMLYFTPAKDAAFKKQLGAILHKVQSFYKDSLEIELNFVPLFSKYDPDNHEASRETSGLSDIIGKEFREFRNALPKGIVYDVKSVGLTFLDTNKKEKAEVFST